MKKVLIKKRVCMMSPTYLLRRFTLGNVFFFIENIKLDFIDRRRKPIFKFNETLPYVLLVVQTEWLPFD